MTLRVPTIPQVQAPRSPRTGENTRPATRRDFFRHLGQLGLAAGLVGLVVGLIRKPSSSLSLQTCVGDSVCRHCRQVKDCSLPAAASMRQVLAKD